MNLGSYRNTHDFMNPTVSMPTSTFNRPSQLKTAFNAGQLIPIFTEEVLPGDTHELTTASFGRFATLIRPILDNVYLDVHYFFVPNRILWDQWETFQAGDDFYAPKNPRKKDKSTKYQSEFVPTISPADPKGFLPDSLADYFGMPTLTDSNTKSSSIKVNCFYHRAYNKIYYDWYMDENLSNFANESNLRTDSEDWFDISYPIRYRSKRRDYFTSCLPWSQKGQPVSIPLGGTLPVRGLFTQPPYNTFGTDGKPESSLNEFLFGQPNREQYEIGQPGVPVDNTKLNSPMSASRPISGRVSGQNLANVSEHTPFSLEYDPNDGTFKAPYVDLGANTVITVNQLREAVSIQRLLEKDARGGTRYVEVIKNHFGVTSPDYRLQRSEFLGSSTQLLDTTAVPQTSSTDAKTPQGHLTSYATSSSKNKVFKKTFTEHGVILGIASARVDQTYQNGLERRFSRRDRYDYYMPALANLGEQPVFVKEIFYSNDSDDDEVFGYIPRWDEYRFKQSHVTGAMRSNYPSGSLDSWHLANNFTQPPFLNHDFIEEKPPIDRVVAVPTEKHFVFDFYFDLVSTRVMPITSIPSLIQKL